MVFCPIHNKYVNGRQAKIKHAYGSKDTKPCKWMKIYISEKVKRVIHSDL